MFRSVCVCVGGGGGTESIYTLAVWPTGEGCGRGSL